MVRASSAQTSRVLTSIDVDRLAGYLIGQGVTEGDVIAVYMTNSSEMVMAIFAIAKLGAVAGLINSALRST